MRSAGKGSTLEQSLARNPSGHWPPDITIRSRGSNATTQRPRVEAGPADRSRGAAFSRKQLQPKYCRINRQKRRILPIFINRGCFQNPSVRNRLSRSRSQGLYGTILLKKG